MSNKETFAKDIAKRFGERAKAIAELVADFENGKKQSVRYDELAIPYVYIDVKRVGNEICIDMNGTKYSWFVEEPKGEK